MNETAGPDEDECVAVWCAGDDWCAVTCAMDVIGNKWHPVIIHRLLKYDELRFNELNDEIDSVTNKVLSQSLEDLQEKDIVKRTVVNDKPVEVEYTLTDYGQTLERVILSLEEWGKTCLRPAESKKNADC